MAFAKIDFCPVIGYSFGTRTGCNRGKSHEHDRSSEEFSMRQKCGKPASFTLTVVAEIDQGAQRFASCRRGCRHGEAAIPVVCPRRSWWQDCALL